MGAGKGARESFAKMGPSTNLFAILQINRRLWELLASTYRRWTRERWKRKDSRARRTQIPHYRLTSGCKLPKKKSRAKEVEHQSMPKPVRKVNLHSWRDPDHATTRQEELMEETLQIRKKSCLENLSIATRSGKQLRVLWKSHWSGCWPHLVTASDSLWQNRVMNRTLPSRSPILWMGAHKQRGFKRQNNS